MGSRMVVVAARGARVGWEGPGHPRPLAILCLAAESPGAGRVPGRGSELGGSMGEAVPLDRSWQLTGLCRGNHSHLFSPPSAVERKEERERRMGRHDRDRAPSVAGPSGARLGAAAAGRRRPWGTSQRGHGHNRACLVCSPCGLARGGAADSPCFHHPCPSPQCRRLRGADGPAWSAPRPSWATPTSSPAAPSTIATGQHSPPGRCAGVATPRSCPGGRPPCVELAEEAGVFAPIPRGAGRRPAAPTCTRAVASRCRARRRSPGLLLQLGDPAARPRRFDARFYAAAVAGRLPRRRRPHRGDRGLLGGAGRGAAARRRRGVAGRVPHPQAPRSPGGSRRRRGGAGRRPGARRGGAGRTAPGLRGRRQVARAAPG